MTRHARGWLAGVVVLASTAACAAGVPAQSGAARAQMRSGQHPCALPGADSGWPDRIVPYDDSLVVGSAPGGVVGSIFNLAGDRLDRAIVSLEPVYPPGPVVGMLADSLGGFRFDGLRPGSYRLTVVRVPEFFTQLQDLRVLSGRTDTICVALRAEPIDIVRPLR